MDPFFESALANFPEDSALRLLLAGWYADRGDGRAIGYRWMAERSKYPFDWRTNQEITGYETFDWYSGEGAIWEVPLHCTLPTELWAAFDPRRIDTGCFSAYRTSRQAEEALCRVLKARTRGVRPKWRRRRRA